MVARFIRDTSNNKIGHGDGLRNAYVKNFGGEIRNFFSQFVH